jgi:hypothetical protein
VIFDGGDETPGLTVNFCYQNKRRKTRPSDLHEEVRFASDSSLEGNEFEPLVPGAKRAGFGGEGELRVRNGVSITGYRWFESISLQRPPSSGESDANLTSDVRRMVGSAILAAVACTHEKL